MLEATQTSAAGATLATSSGTTPEIPGYELGELIGRGGMGDVYRARDLEMDREVAVKILQDRYTPGSENALRFVAEAKITGQLQHPGIPAIYRVSKLPDGRPFLAMKLIKGQTLDELLKGNAHHNPLAIIEAVAQALGYAHAHDVIHRDIKPANVMVGAFGEIQLMDWGLAKVMTAPTVVNQNSMPSDPDATTAATVIQSSRDSTATQFGSILGTPSYMPPEQAGGENDRVGKPSDVFGLGALWCKLLTGHAPFPGNDADSVRRNAMRGKMDESLARLENCSAEPEIIALVKQCLNFEPADRPQDANVVAGRVAELRIAAEERAKQAELSRARAEVQSAEQTKRRRTLLIAGCLIVSALLLGLGLSLWQMNRAVQAEEAAKLNAEHAQANEAKANAERDEKEAQRKLAVEFRDQALGALRAMTGEDVENLLAERKELSSNERAYLEAIAARWQTLTKRTGRDEMSRAMQAEGNYRVANLWHRLGRQAEARSLYEKSIPLWEELITKSPTAPYYRIQLATSMNDMGILLDDLGERTAAREHYEKAIAILEKLTTEFPEVLDYQSRLAGSLNNIGSMLSNLNEKSAAREYYQKAISIQEKLVTNSPGVPQYREFLANHYHNLGNLHGLNERKTAWEHYQKALAIREKLVSEFPAVAKYREHLANNHTRIASLTRDLFQMWEHYKKAISIREKLVTEFPAVPQYRQHLAGDYYSIGILLSSLGNQTVARDSYQKAISILEKLAVEFPTFANRVTLAGCHTNLSILLNKPDERTSQWKHCQEAFTIHEKLVAEFPTERRCRIDLGGSYCNVGNLVKNKGELAESLRWYDKAIDTLLPIQQADPRDPTVFWNLIQSHFGRAMAFEQLDKPGEAAKDWNRIIELTSSPEHKANRDLRVVALAKIGDFNRAVAEVTDLTKSNNWTANDWYNFAWVYASASGKDKSKQEEYATRAMELLRQSVKAGFKDRGQMQKHFDTLSHRDDFKKLLESLPKEK